MKKIIIALFSIAIWVSSCDMDKRPYGSLDDETAIQGLDDSKRFRDGLYSNMRTLTTGAYIYTSDIQMDIVQGVIGNGNRNGMFANGNLVSSDQTVVAIWAAFYSVINSANYFIERVENLINSNEFTDDELLTLNRYMGEAHFVRGYCYYWLADRFCQVYSSTDAQTPAKGLPLVTIYHPTGNMSSYPGRNTLEETYKLIEDDLASAYTALAAYEVKDKEAVAPGAIYFSTYTVLALQARIALLKGDNATALSKAETIINANVYKLTPAADYAKMWSEDTGSEIIFRSFMSNTELGGSVGAAYLSVNQDFADYIPTFDILNLYADEDVRFDAFFTVWNLNVQGDIVQAYVFNKYPGNESLKTGASPNYMNMSKPFRLSEIYLIAAEAAISTSADKANKYLNDLRAERIEGYQAETYSGQALVQQVREERLKELVGEGYRMSDLRRWGLGFSRNPKHPENPDIESSLIVAGNALSYNAGDHRFIWPIPTSEIEANPQLDGQQNPGY